MSQAQQQQSQNTKQDQSPTKAPGQTPEIAQTELELPALTGLIGPSMAGGSAPVPPPNITPNQVLSMQRQMGNQTTNWYLGNRKPVQTKLTIGPVDDPYEREADRVADQVMRLPDTHQPAKQIQTLAVQRSSDNGGGGEAADGGFEQALGRRQGGGQPLPDRVRDSMETRFGADFSDVRVHADSEAQQLSKSIQAQAFTHGRDVYFGPGHYSPENPGGQRLLAHELTHVMQQTGGGAKKAQRSVVQREGEGGGKGGGQGLGNAYEMKWEFPSKKNSAFSGSFAISASRPKGTVAESGPLSAGEVKFGRSKSYKPDPKKGGARTNPKAGQAISATLLKFTGEVGELWPGFKVAIELKALEAKLNDGDSSKADISLLKAAVTGTQTITKSEMSALQHDPLFSSFVPTSVINDVMSDGYELKAKLAGELKVDQFVKDILQKKAEAKAKAEAIEQLTKKKQGMVDEGKKLQEQLDKAKTDASDVDSQAKKAQEAKDKSQRRKDNLDKEAKEKNHKKAKRKQQAKSRGSGGDKAKKARKAANQQLKAANEAATKAGKQNKAAQKAVADLEKKIAKNKTAQKVLKEGFEKSSKELGEKILKEQLERTAKKAAEKTAKRMAVAALKGVGRMALKFVPILGWAMAAYDVAELAYTIYQLASGKMTFGLGDDSGSGGAEGGDQAQGSTEGVPGGVPGAPDGGVPDGGTGDTPGGVHDGGGGTGDGGVNDTGSGEGGEGGESETEDGGTAGMKLTESAELVVEMLQDKEGFKLSDEDRQKLNALIPTDMTKDQLTELVKSLTEGGTPVNSVEEAIEALRKNVDKIKNPPPAKEIEGDGQPVPKPENDAKATSGDKAKKKEAKGESKTEKKGNKAGAGGDGTAEGSTGPTAGDPNAKPTEEKPSEEKSGGEKPKPESKSEGTSGEGDKTDGGGNSDNDEDDPLEDYDENIAEYITAYKGLAKTHGFYASFNAADLKEDASLAATIVISTSDGFFGGYTTIKVVKSLGANVFEVNASPFMAYDQFGFQVGMHSGFKGMRAKSDVKEATKENK